MITNQNQYMPPMADATKTPPQPGGSGWGNVPPTQTPDPTITTQAAGPSLPQVAPYQQQNNSQLPSYNLQQPQQNLALPNLGYAKGGDILPYISRLGAQQHYYAKGGNIDTFEKEKRPTKTAKMIMAHVSKVELRGLDTMQNGRTIDPETGLPQYQKIDKLLDDPEVLEIILSVFKDLNDDGKVDPEVVRESEKIDKAMPASPSHDDMPYKEEREIAHKGAKADKALALIPLKLADLLDELRGFTDTNEKTGLPQYFFLGGLLKLAGPLIGGLTSFFGARKRRNQELDYQREEQERQARFRQEEEERQRALGSAFTKAVEDSRNKLTSIDFIKEKPTASSDITKISSSPTDEENIKRITDFFANKAENPSIIPSTDSPKLDAKNQDIPIRADFNTKKEAVIDPTSRKVDKAIEVDKLLRSRPIQQHIMPMTTVGVGNNSLGGYIQPFKKGGSVDDEKDIKEKGYLFRTGLIKGHVSTGIEDDLKFVVPESSYIIDASTTSAIGDGSSNAGGHIMKKFLNEITKKQGIEVAPNPYEKYAPVDVLLSNQEIFIEPDQVAALGGGNSKEGANALKKFVKNVRHYKKSNGLGLPPPIDGDLLKFFPKNVQKRFAEDQC